MNTLAVVGVEEGIGPEKVDFGFGAENVRDQTRSVLIGEDRRFKPLYRVLLEFGDTRLAIDCPTFLQRRYLG